MPVKLSNLRESSKNIRIQFPGDGDLNVTVYPHRINQDMLDRYQAAVQDKDYDLAAEIFREVVPSWDLLGDDEEPLPIDGAAFQLVGTGVMNELWDRIHEAIAPKSRKTNARS